MGQVQKVPTKAYIRMVHKGHLFREKGYIFPFETLSSIDIFFKQKSMSKFSRLVSEIA